MEFLKHIVNRGEDAGFLSPFCVWHAFNNRKLQALTFLLEVSTCICFLAVQAKHLGVFVVTSLVPGWATWVVCLTLGLLCDFLSPRAFDFYNLETSDASIAGCWFHDQVPEMATKGAGLLPWVPPFSL